MNIRSPHRALQIILMAGFLILLLVPGGMVRADIGPKPSMNFEFVQPEGSDLAIMEGTLLQCQDESCQDAKPLLEAGPQRFVCSTSACSSKAYSYSPYQRLAIRFSDGKTRESNVFGKRFFDARYRVTIRQNDLLVEEQLGRPNPLGLALFAVLGLACVAGLALVALLVILIRLGIKAQRGRANYFDSPGLFISAWLVSLLLLGAGSFLTLALPLTVAIEAGMVWIYARWRGYPALTWTTLIILANLVTLPFLWLSLKAAQGGYSWILLLLGELVVWFLEALILFLTQRNILSFKLSLKISLALNATSFAVGLLLPF